MDAIMVLVSPPNCISVAKARDSQQSDVPMVSVSSCYSGAVLQGAGQNGLDGWVVNQYFDDPSGDSDAAQIYQSKMKQYAGADANLSGFAPVAFSNVMTVYNNLLQEEGPDATAEQLVTKVSDPAGGKVFMGPDYQCGAAENPYKAICNYNLQWFEIEAGKLTNPTGFVDLRPTIKAAQS
jgi:ABC-type branched-subunit amino acid transport system substrate-binding protein